MPVLPGDFFCSVFGDRVMIRTVKRLAVFDVEFFLAGLGLAFVAKTVADHGGVIEVDSLPRKSIFRLTFPIVDEPTPRRVRRRSEGPVSGQIAAQIPTEISTPISTPQESGDE